MGAVIIWEYGGSPHVEDLPSPEVQSGQVMIKVLAAGMNPMDRVIAGGGWDSIMPATSPIANPDDLEARGVTAVTSS